jgi:exodeoxyribonuclease VII large subunit
MQEIEQIKKSYEQTISFKFQNFTKEYEHIKMRFPHAIDSLINLKQNQVLSLTKMLESNHPKNKSKSGFAQLSQNSKVIDISSLEIDDIFYAQSDTVSLKAKVLGKKTI